jgi:glyoxylase-like metal-dependent hydrolase (beta-lactamase superfamily II)
VDALPAVSLTFGGTELTLVPDGEMHVVPGDGLHGVPADEGRAEWAAYTPPDADGRVRVMPNSLLVRSPRGVALVDAGGESPEERPERRTDFLAKLEGLGVRRDDVSTLIVTHAHLDHIGYLCIGSGDGRVPAFPNAQVFIQRIEAEAFASADSEGWERYFAPLEEAKLLCMVEGDREVAPGLTCLATPGHTSGHQSVLIESAGDDGDGTCAMYVGDLAATALHLEHPDWHSGWTWSREAELASKRKVVDLAVARDAVVILGHDPRTPFGRLERGPEGVSVRPVGPSPGAAGTR